ncbi:hypothetical protein A4H97_11455 [Niastella yeongjuensis]|uniref:Cupin type-2 domain-containing protein n=1 Tax=Niastella yeongjuensis TaxID=354355 RepID=A0A1V9E9H8_9BACT|nr:cupin domain-containing protein [Niastella yeongjuensis]OQP42773.1 hypothetical protein A4H97_11455 [Niastella yeongjuensis]SEO53350.1 Mannose-6-phosphate isomerase, cupin superfamily [Niastella yeongjuensis]
MNNSYWLFEGFLTILADEKSTDGRYDLIEGVFPPGIETPLHLHNRYSEVLYVQEGEFTVYMENGTHVLKAGEHVFIPVGAPHAVVNTSTGFSKALAVASPSGFAELIRSVGIAGKQSDGQKQPNDMGAFMQFSEKIGDVFLGPPGSRPAVK